jgi:phage tail sheath protein FI
MATYKTPGVYIEEISTLPATVVRVETAVPAFIGFTGNHDAHPSVTMADPSIVAANDKKVNPTRPIKIQSLREYENIFGKGPAQDFTIDVEDEVDSADKLKNRTLTVTKGTAVLYTMYYQMQMYFANGGGTCFVVSAGLVPNNPKVYASGNKALLKKAIDELKKEDEPTLLVMADATSLSATDYKEMAEYALDHCYLMRDRFCILDVPAETLGEVDTKFRNLIGTSHLNYGAAYFPALNTTLSWVVDESAQGITTHEVTGGTPPPDYLDDPAGIKLVNLADFSVGGKTYREDLLYNQIKAKIDEIPVVLYPSGAIAGVYCQVDNSRGVWKAPANVSLRAVTAPSLAITNPQQATLNEHTTGKSVNAIRSFTGRGILVWGARTLDGNSGEWKYISVRRLFLMMEESIQKATEFVVFEPNDANTWQKVKAMVENFLIGLWRDGALAGATAKEAFFVNVGLGSSMTSQDILDGNLIVEIGVAAVRPAEYIILRFSHKLQES